jgi:hypothetical protein
MSQQIPVAFVNQYHADVEMLLQQKGSRLRSCVRVESQKGEAQFYEQIGPTDAVEITTRHGDSPQVDSVHDRRRVTLRFFDWGDFIDRIDKVQMLIDPTNAYTQNAVYALGRTYDQRIIDAASGTAFTGHAGATSTTLPATQKVAVGFGGTNVGLTVAKLVEARRILVKGENDMDEPQYLAYASQGLADLLNTTEVTSADYNSVKALVKGEINSFMGFEFVHTELLTVTGTSPTAQRLTLAWAKSGLLLAVSPDVETAVERRWDKRGSVYVYAVAGSGAVRMQEKKVVEITTLE